MRILHIVSFYEQDISKGGVGRAAGLLARIQARVGADVTIFPQILASKRTGRILYGRTEGVYGFTSFQLDEVRDFSFARHYSGLVCNG